MSQKGLFTSVVKKVWGKNLALTQQSHFKMLLIMQTEWIAYIVNMPFQLRKLELNLILIINKLFYGYHDYS